MDLTEAEDIKKRRQEYTEELYKRGLNDLVNQDSELNPLEPDILECEVKWALGSITTHKASGGDGIPVELFQILKDNAMKMLQLVSPGEGNGNPLRYSCLGNAMDRGAWWATVDGVSKR